jgi:hypothetical protein
MENSIVKSTVNLKFSKAKTKWEVISRVTEIYLQTIRIISLLEEDDAESEKFGHKKTCSEEIKRNQKYASEILALIKILVNSSNVNDT